MPALGQAIGLPFRKGMRGVISRLRPYQWLKADAIIGSVNNDLLATWTDSSTNGKTVTATGTDRPTYNTNVVNGKPAIHFNNNRLEGPTMISMNTTFTTHIVAKSDADVGSRIVAYGQAGPQTWCLPGVGLGIVHTATVDASTGIGQTYGTSWNIWSMRLGGTLLEFFKNGTLIASNAAFAFAYNANLSLIGSGYNSFKTDEPLTGYIAENVVFSSTHNTANFLAVVRSLGNKYGIVTA